MPVKKEKKTAAKVSRTRPKAAGPKPLLIMEQIHPLLIRLPNSTDIVIPDIDYNAESPFHTFMQIAYNIGWANEPLDGPVRKGRIWKMIKKGGNHPQYLLDDSSYASQGITDLVRQVDIVEVSF